MGNRDIKKTEKKKKKADTKTVAVSSTVIKPMVTQPELIKKPKKALK